MPEIKKQPFFPFSFLKFQILDRYIIKELLSPFYLGIMVFTFVFLVTQIFRITEMILNKGIPLISTLQLISYIMPQFFVLIIPSTLLLASLVGFGRIAGDCEAVAFQSSGISFLRLLRPVIYFSLAAYMATMYVMIYVVPKANSAFTRTVYQLIKSNVVMNIQEKVFFGDLKGMVIYVDQAPKDGSPYRKVLISDHRKSDNKYIIVAETGIFGFDNTSESIYVHLTDGEIHQLTPKGRYRKLSFKEYDLNLDSGDFFRKKRKMDRDLTVDELKSKIARRKKDGHDYLSQEVELYKKYSLPFSALLLGFLGASIGIRKRSRSQDKSLGFAFCLLIMFGYYLILRTMETMGDNGIIVPWLSVWTPNFLLAGLTGYLVISEEKQHSIKWLEWVAGQLGILICRIKDYRKS